MKCECIEFRREQYPVRMMCRLLYISKSGYYAWRTRPESQRSKTNRKLLPIIKRLHKASGGVYGSPKIQVDLKEEGYHYGRNKVAKIMRNAGLKGCPKKQFKVTTQPDPSHAIANNLLQQDFSVKEPNRCWVGDITYIATNQGWLYLSIILDLFSRKIVGWSMSRWLSRHLAVDALRMAVAMRRPNGLLIHHSDRGAQYTSDDFQEELGKNSIQCSMSGKGNCYDNAVAESFFGLLKRERVNRKKYRSRDEARRDLFDYIECFYNQKRRHSYLNYLSPVNYEELYNELF